ncbi:4-alpha-glucanotransferase [Burkholderia sp. BCCIQ04A]|uniref:4-alpha-glucanotransferase n=1 Tax=Burkholderia anthinoferrum TaxID=3090833 RepID=A0ABU5WGV7_9BURK|nr:MULTISPECIES: 4-alpha-glucanotransferase [Burkholderia]MEB2504446.1 4-alpha-glucanotransferase [Burkholderia anthinoferrum]MEB2578207.1 4-alpha-glucanotransferase [Burkholderia anthinoferrum]MCA8105554.1 4-alpha-glucanotransferase [Burkholderia sp. AU36459]MDF3101649.1 4-alpha-glucanotransferase [Burkholderia semiarida]MDF3114587.1 4-alpha-glucanotransferase [Burkholderia semiarida]
MTTDVPIAALARAAGLEPDWTDAGGVARRVDDDALVALVDALGWPCGTAIQRVDSAAALADANAAPPRTVTGDAGLPLTLPATVAAPGARFRISLESGGHVDGRVGGTGEHGTLPPLAMAGYHALDVGEQRIGLAIAPPRARPFDAFARTRDANSRWGIAAQLYGLRRTGDDGAGDYTTLARLAAHAARHGAQAVAISPTHAGFPALPAHDSPYSPSSRRWHNVAYLDCDAVPGADAAPRASAAVADADAALIDWPRVLPAKLRRLRACFDAWRASDDPSRDTYQRFRAAGGAALDAHARFDALQAFCIEHGIGADWRQWPAQWRMPGSAEVDAFAHAHADTIAFHTFLQWCASRALGDAQHAARGAGMATGLIADLAVGSDRAGSDAWAHGTTLLRGVSLGAPPDLFNAAGQAWGVTTWTPAALRADGFVPFIELLRAAFAHAGGIRIDHVLGFARMWIVPDGGSPRSGAYLRYPLDDLVRLVALEAARHRAIAIGEDLGTVPAGLRERLSAQGVAGMRVLWFERDANGAFRPPSAWDRDAIATTSTHDLPTVAGWWRGVDLGWRRVAADAEAGKRRDDTPPRDVAAPAPNDASAHDSDEIVQRMAFGHDTVQRPEPGKPTPPPASPPELLAAHAERATERAALWHALQQAGCAPAGAAAPPADMPPVNAILGYVAISPSPLALLPLEDLLALDAQPNLPRPPCGHPNWRQRLPRTVDTLFDTDVRTRIAAVVHARRSRGRRS